MTTTVSTRVRALFRTGRSVVRGRRAVPGVLVLCLCAAGLAQQDDRMIVIPAGTAVELRLDQDLSSAEFRPGDTVEFVVAEDVLAGGVAAVRRGSRAWGTVSGVSRRGRFARSGRINVELAAACMADGAQVPLGVAPGRRILELGEEVRSDGFLSLPALPVLMFLEGKELRLERGHEVPAVTREAIAIHPSRFHDPQPNRNCQAPEPGAQSANGEGPGRRGGRGSQVRGIAVVQVQSLPSGAEVFVDGLYAGDTPSTLRLTAGTHHIRLKKAGLPDWEREVWLAPGGEVTLSPQLDTYNEAALPAKRRSGSGLDGKR